MVRGGAQVRQALTRRLGGLCIKRKFIKDGQGKDEDKGADDGGGHATGRRWACGSLTMDQGGCAPAQDDWGDPCAWLGQARTGQISWRVVAAASFSLLYTGVRSERTARVKYW